MEQITGLAQVDSHLEKMVEADRGRYCEEAHIAEDNAMTQMLVLLAEERATPGQAAAMVKFLFEHHRTPPIPERWYS